MRLKRKETSYYISLGTGVNQLPVILSAKRKKMQVIGVDRNIYSPGMRYCDIQIQESIFNYHKIYKQLQFISINGVFKGVVACSYGQALLSSAFLATKLDLISIPYQQMKVLLDKYRVRMMLDPLFGSHAHANQPRFWCLDKQMSIASMETIPYPWILKHKNGYAKKNIFLITDRKLLKSILNIHALQKNQLKYTDLLIEEFISGDEIITVGLVSRGVYQLVSLTDKLTTKESPFLDIEHKCPSKYIDQQKILTEIHQEMIDTLQISDASLVSEWKYYNNKFYLIEVSPQVPGEYIASHLIPYAYGYNYFNNLVNLTIGQKLNPSRILTSKNVPTPVSIKYILQKPSQTEWAEHTHKADFSCVLNENPVHPPLSNHDRYGVIINQEKLSLLDRIKYLEYSLICENKPFTLPLLFLLFQYYSLYIFIFAKIIKS